MAPYKSDRPSDIQLAAVVEKCQDGMTALALMDHFVKEDYPAHAVQKAIQSALNSGALELGSKLRLYAREKVAA